MVAKMKDEKTMDMVERTDLTPEVLGELFDPKDRLSGIELRLQQIGIIHQGQLFEMPNGEKRGSFRGTILDICNVNAWWEEHFDKSGGGTPPQCYSMNGVAPHPLSEKIQAAECTTCHRNAFGSDGGRGKACKNMKRIHIMLPGERFPKRLTAPPSSLKAVNIYGSLLEDQGMPYPIVDTEFGLKLVSNKDGIKYSELSFEKKGLAAKTMEEAQAIKKIRERFMPIMREEPILSTEFNNAEG